MSDPVLDADVLTLRGIIAAAEERGRDELRAALKAAEKDRDTWKRLCETADAQATAATVRANKLANQRGYDIDDDAEERGRRAGIEERDELRAVLKALVDRLDFIHDDPRYVSVWSLSQNHVGPYRGPTYVDELNRARAALAPRDSAPEPARMDTTHGPTCWCGKPSHHESGWCGGLACQGGAPRDSGKEPK